MAGKDRPHYDRDTSSDTEDYQDSEDTRRRVFKNRSVEVAVRINSSKRIPCILSFTFVHC